MELNLTSGVLVKAENPIQYRIMLPNNLKREFWSVPNQLESNINFKIYQFKLIPTAIIMILTAPWPLFLMI